MINEKINYVELPAKDLAATKRFFSAAFGWEFTDYGPEYTAFSQSGINGGFYQSDLISSTRHGAALIVLYSKALEQSQERVTQAGGAIVKTISPFRVGDAFILRILMEMNALFGLMLIVSILIVDFNLHS